MKRWRIAFCLAGVFGCLAFLGIAAPDPVGAEPSAAGAPTNRVIRQPRTYTGRVEWHDMPADLEAPRQVEQPAEMRQELFQTPKSPFADSVTVESMAPAYLYQQPPVRLREREDKKKQRNWLVLQVTDQKEKEKEDAREKNTRAVPADTGGRDTGWGWLASSVLRQQEIQKTEKQAVEDEDTGPETSVLATEALMQKAAATQSGLIVMPTSSGTPGLPGVPLKPMLDVQEKASLNRVAIDDELPGISPTRTSYGRTEAPSRPEINSGPPTFAGWADRSALASDSVKQSGIDSPANVLPKTAALLSRPMPLEVSAKPGSRGDAGSLFQGARPTSAFDLSMPSSGLSGSPFSDSRVGSGGGASAGFFSPPRSLSSEFAPVRPQDQGLLMPAPPAGGGMTPARSSVPSERPMADTPAFPTAPSWRR